ncbi:MAG: cation diffusion facilitator family transporter [Sulfurimonadaceae bacterium]|nr:cation diffusion facilitator family transporter [Sulfurimonadaceae bacterium]
MVDLEKRATLISSTVATILVLIKMVVGVLSGSIAILASAIDSLLDLVISLFNYFALHNAQKEADETFHFGRNKLEPLAATIEGVIISFSALFILYEAITKIIYPRDIEYIGSSIAVMLISIVMTLALVLYLNSVAKKTNNMVIKADALHYKTDLFSNAGVVLALLLVHFSGLETIDALLGIAIAIYMLYSAYPIIKEGILMLLDAALPPEDIEKITNLLDSNKDTSSYHDLQTRASGSHIFVALHLVFSVSTSLFEAHRVSDRVELAIKRLFPDHKVHVLVHMDPYDDSDINELEEFI